MSSETKDVGRGFKRNNNMANFDPTAHAEVIAVREPARGRRTSLPPKLRLSGKKMTD